MKDKIKWILVAAVALLVLGCVASFSQLSRMKEENKRLQSNVSALRKGMSEYIVKDSMSAFSIEQLRVRNDDLNEYSQTLASAVEDMRIKLKNVESAAQTQTQTHIAVDVPLRDTIYLHDTIIERAKTFKWHDAWCTIDGIIAKDSVSCAVASVDTIIQVVHRVPKKWLFFTCGTKAIRQDIMSTNPHTKVVFTEYIELE